MYVCMYVCMYVSARSRSEKRDRGMEYGNACNHGIVFAIPPQISFDSFQRIQPLQKYVETTFF